MSFSQVVILQLVILVVVLESDLGRKRIGWFRVARPIIAAVAIVPSYLSSVPTGGNDLILQAAGAATGIVLGLVVTSPAVVAVGYDPAFRSWWGRRLKRRPRAASVTVSGAGYAAIWIVVTAARLAFAYGSQHTFPHALGGWLGRNDITAAALTNALIFLPLGMDVFRSVGLFARGAAARSSHRPLPQPA